MIGLEHVAVKVLSYSHSRCCVDRSNSADIYRPADKMVVGDTDVVNTHRRRGRRAEGQSEAAQHPRWCDMMANIKIYERNYILFCALHFFAPALTISEIL